MHYLDTPMISGSLTEPNYRIDTVIAIEDKILKQLEIYSIALSLNVGTRINTEQIKESINNNIQKMLNNSKDENNG